MTLPPARDQLCRRCWQPAQSWQHRVAAGRGGPTDLFNCVPLCGDGTRGCHGWAEANPTEAQAVGLDVPGYFLRGAYVGRDLDYQAYYSDSDTMRRLLSHAAVDPIDCWSWTASLDGRGYGQFAPTSGRTHKAHRAVLALLRIDLTDLDVHHQCGQPTCIRPTHLRPLTRAEHATQHRPEVCSQGHPLTDDNVYTAGRPTRVCATCHRERQRQYRARKAAP